MPQVIDYKLTPVDQYFVENPPSPKFHAAFGNIFWSVFLAFPDIHTTADAIGSVEIFTSSPAYLDRNGIFVSVGIFGGGVKRTLEGFFKTSIWPRFLGGTPRSHK